MNKMVTSPFLNSYLASIPLTQKYPVLQNRPLSKCRELNVNQFLSNSTISLQLHSARIRPKKSKMGSVQVRFNFQTLYPPPRSTQIQLPSWVCSMVNLHCPQLTAPLHSSPPWLHHSKDDIRRYPNLWQHAGATREAMEGRRLKPPKRTEVESYSIWPWKKGL